jgi:hypothetical protein
MNPMDAAWTVLKADLRESSLGLRIAEAQSAARSRADPYSQPEETKGTPYYQGGKKSILLSPPFGVPELTGLTPQQHRLLNRRGERGESRIPIYDDEPNPLMAQQTSPAPPPADPEFMARIKADEEETKQRKTEREERKR